MKPKMKKIHFCLKNFLTMMLILSLVGTNLFTSAVTVYAEETTAVTTEKSDSDGTKEENSNQDEGATEETTKEGGTEESKTDAEKIDSGTATDETSKTDTSETGTSKTETQEKEEDETETDTTETGEKEGDETETNTEAGEKEDETEQDTAETDETETDETKTNETEEKDSTISDTTTNEESNITTKDETNGEDKKDEKQSGEKGFAEEKTYTFGSNKDISKDTLFSEEIGYGYSDVTFPDEAAGWVSHIYYPRESNVTQSAASFVEDGEDYAEISSKVWTETESSGYGVFTYESTSTLDFNLDPANYNVKVSFINPTESEISAYVESEDITKVNDISIAPGETKDVEFTACLIDDILNLKFLAASSATSEGDAQTKTVYVQSVSLEKTENEAGNKPTVFIASDSTVQTYDEYYYPQTGWGQTLYNFFGNFMEERECDDCDYSQSQTYETDQVIIENRAIGGRSSKSFIDEGKLDDLLEDIKPGDYLLVQWAHNDSTYSRPNRYVSPEDFGKWIQYYVDGAQQRGATCVLVTPVARYSYTTTESGELDTFVSNFEAYRSVMLDISSEQDVPLVDLTSLSIDVCNSFGIEGAKSLFLQLAAGEYDGYYAGGVSDATHLQYYGAYKFAQCVAKGIKSNEQLEELSSYITLTLPDNLPTKPTNLTATSVGASSISMSWDEDEDAELYYVYRQVLENGQTVDDVDFTNATKYSVSSNALYTDSNCEGGKNYVYAIAGFNELGIGELSEKIVVSTKSSAYKFDFGIASSSNVMEGWTEVTENQMYSADVGYGFINAPGNGRNRSGNGNADSSAMADDFCLGEGVFALDIPNGDYEVTIYAGDLLPGTSTIKPSYTGEDVSIGTLSTRQALGSITAMVRVTDGQLNIGIGGGNPYINGMEVTPILGTPTQLSYSEMNFTTTQATFLINFTGIDEASYYNVYQKSSTDSTFSVAKTIQAEDLDNLDARAMAATLGETYQYYVTAVIASGQESAASNTIEIEMIDPNVDVPMAPTNVICDSAENGKITISWDSEEGVFEYNIYRSDKAETDKGFKEFTKVGTSSSASFTDTDRDLTTNIHYYYKVQGKNSGGVGELSDACETPITGELIAAAPEKLSDRGVVAVNLAGDDGASTNLSATDSEGNKYTNGVYVSWRAFEEDFDGENNLTTTFTVYRNDTVIATDVAVTNLVDEGGSAQDVYKVIGNNDDTLNLSVKDTVVWQNKYLELQLCKPADETMPDASTCTFTANDMSVGDVDGDGDYELFVKWAPSNAKDNSHTGYTGKTFIDAYDIDMTTGLVKLLYRIDLGVNIRSGAHYTQFQVWDFDGDHKAELAVKTADGSTIYQSSDGTDEGLVETGYVGECDADALQTDIINSENDYRNTAGRIIEGPEYLTMFDDDGTILSTTDYIPERGDVSAWGDGYGNRVDRFLSGVAYLNGETPFAVFCRGYYSRMTMTAYYLLDTNEDGIGDTLDTYWKFDTNDLLEDYDQALIEAQGDHSLSINDVDNDGKDEIIYGSVVVDHDGTLKYSTGLGHGDAMHVSDWVGWNDGLEIMQVHEHIEAPYHVEVHDAETGEILMGYFTGTDTGRGVAADIDPTYPYGEFWAIAGPNYSSNDEPSWDSKDGGVYSTASTLDHLITISEKSPASNFSIFWDGDLLSEIFDHTFDKEAYAPITTTIAKWNYETEQEDLNFESDEVYTSNGTKGNAGLIADILGDWREEVILRCSADNSKIRVYSTTIQTDYVVPCLMENLAYREGVAWQNVGYNQPANLSYLLSEGLITSEVSVEESTKDSVTIDFTPANDGTYGHDIQGYEVYRADEGSDEYSLVASIPMDSLNIKEGTSGNETVYVYKDTSVSGGKSYLYKVAAIVDNKTSFMSRTASANTLVDVKEVKDINLDDIVEDTVLTEGQTVADLLPTTVTVVDTNDNEALADVTWDVSEVDITTPGTYKVYAAVAGYSDTVETTLTIIENTVTGYTPIDDIRVIKGTEAVLPNTVEVTYLNNTTKNVNVVSWNGDIDTNILGTYQLTAELEDTSEVVVKVTVLVVEDYVVSINESLDPIEVVVNSEITSSQLPSAIEAVFASGNTGVAPITWNTDNLDTSSAGVITINGTVEGYDPEISILVHVVNNLSLYKFDFGISDDNVADGWTGITVNGKYDTVKASDLGIVYSSEKGYGFDIDDDTVVNGRLENFSYTDTDYPIPDNAYNDFALTGGFTFNVDVENGNYIVELMSNSIYKSDIRGTIEGNVSFAVANSASTYKIGSYEVEVTDGQLNIAFDSNRVSRLGAIIIRPATPTDTDDPTDPPTPGVTCRVHFNSNGGSDIDFQTIEYGKLAKKPIKTEKEGYEFEGWYKEDSLTTKWDFAKDIVTEDTILYAKWNAIKVTNIKFNKKSLTVGVNTSTILAAAVSPSNAANKEILWSSSDSKIASVNQVGVVDAKKKGTVIITATAKDGSNVTATCKIKVGYKITYQLNGGTNNEKNPSGFLSNKTLKLKNPTKKGYTFQGWYKDENYKTKIKKVKKGTEGNITIYAKWKKITVDKVTIKSLKNSGKLKMKIKYKKVNKAKGYEIVYATNKEFTKNVKTITVSGRSKTIKKLTKGATYYVKVRAYKVDASKNKIYGKFSSVKKVKIKK